MSTQANGRPARARKASAGASQRNERARHVREHRPSEELAVRARPEQDHIPGFNPDATPC